MINTKFLHNNYKVICDYNNYVCFLNTKKKYIHTSQLLEVVNYENSNIYSEIKLFCKMNKDNDIKTYNKYISWDLNMCDMAYKYILSLSSSIKIKKNNKSINKYIISNKWKNRHYIKNNTLHYKYKNNKKKVYTKIEKELFLKEHNSKLIFSDKFVSSIKNLLLDNNNLFIIKFIKNVFQYEDDVVLLNLETIKLTLNKMNYNNKIELIILLLNNNVPIYVKQKLQFVSIQLEMDKEKELCYINTNWKELQKIFY